MPTCLPLVRRRCHACGCERFRTGGKFRINAHRKLLDVWLLVLCTTCEDTVKLTVLDRTSVRAVRPALLDRLHANDIGLAVELLQDPALLHRNRVALDWQDAWRLETGGTAHLDQESIDVSVRFAAAIPIRPLRLIAEGCALTRAQADRLAKEGKLVSAVRLNTRSAGDFTFTLKR
ncbi:DUF1062 domain-containing protein [Actinacidiphila guanduensis]|uniref:DUF1062 domain-containing protein n=1 Tax=Actinacidiphila guanduensis TaxID=310781 RepID=A0A1H0BH05_9ACTN|nr:DUF1062 domain-containing protein [Actinacidiphila guanduensis]SDN44865.1 hypothetical protein SAMN05216259_104182 [Actinacidiphila guanduensis]